LRIFVFCIYDIILQIINQIISSTWRW